MTRFLYTPHALSFPERVRRGALRPKEMRDAEFEAQFDWDTFIYDAFHYDGSYFLIAPPMFGVDWRVDWPSAFRAVGAEAEPVAWLDKSMRVKARIEAGSAIASSMEIPFQQASSVHAAIGTPARNEIFAGQRVLVTMSKDNEIAWIRDWIMFHAKAHKATGALIYDNNSQRYTPQELLDGLAGLPVASIVVVAWPFKYGPQGIIKTNSHWDSNFCQHGGLEHARYFFLRQAASFLNCDVDELVVPMIDGASVFEEAERQPGYVFFGGQWVEPLNAAGDKPRPIQERRHSDFVLRKRDLESRSHAAYKYCVAVSRLTDEIQCATHRIIDARQHGTYAFASVPASRKFVYRHFKAINTNWRWQRDWVPSTDLAQMEVDTDLERLMAVSICA